MQVCKCSKIETMENKLSANPERGFARVSGGHCDSCEAATPGKRTDAIFPRSALPPKPSDGISAMLRRLSGFTPRACLFVAFLKICSHIEIEECEG